MSECHKLRFQLLHYTQTVAFSQVFLTKFSFFFHFNPKSHCFLHISSFAKSDSATDSDNFKRSQERMLYTFQLWLNAKKALSKRAWSLPPAVRETGKQHAEGLSAKLTEGVTAFSQAFRRFSSGRPSRAAPSSPARRGSRTPFRCPRDTPRRPFRMPPEPR